MKIWEEIKSDARKGAGRLIAEYGDRLYSAALILTQDGHSAEDLVSRTVRQAVVKIGRYKPEHDFWNWLYTIQLNFWRSDMRKFHVEVAESADFIEKYAETAADEREAPALSAADAERVRGAVSLLVPAMRAVVELYYFEERTLDETAKLLGIPLGTVKCHLHRARMTLSAMLSPLFNAK